MSKPEKPREWWVYTGAKGPVVFMKELTTSGSPGIHVIEKSAYDALAEKLKAAEAERDGWKRNYEETSVLLFESGKEKDQLREQVRGLERKLQYAIDWAGNGPSGDISKNNLKFQLDHHVRRCIDEAGNIRGVDDLFERAKKLLERK